KEEILTDVTKDRACDTPHSNRQNGQGTGDMPEAWGNANAVDLLRDMLVQERSDVPVTTESKTTLHLLAGLPSEWIGELGDVASVERTPTTLGTTVSVKATRTSAMGMRVEFDPGKRGVDTLVHVPLADKTRLIEAKMDGKALPANAIRVSANGQQAIVAVGQLAHAVTFDFTFASIGAAR
ncbi:MAG: hypothetical protein M3O31_13495, partial [Acidobacteriota bacterium]|nr:hypothetical protein [Acidobacteriota bacterium]